MTNGRVFMGIKLMLGMVAINALAQGLGSVVESNSGPGSVMNAVEKISLIGAMAIAIVVLWGYVQKKDKVIDEKDNMIRTQAVTTAQLAEQFRSTTENFTDTLREIKEALRREKS